MWGKRANAVGLLKVTHVSSLAGPRQDDATLLRMPN